MSNPCSPPDTGTLETPAAVRPRPLVAVLLGLVVTGAGYYYAGARWRLVALAAVFPAWLVCLALSVRAGLSPLALAPLLALTLLMYIDTFRQARRPDARRPPWPELAGAILLCLVYFQGISLLFRAFILEPFSVPSASMTPALLPGDYILVDKTSYAAGEPRRGDIVVLGYPDDPSVRYVKRIIGLPGDVVGMTTEDQVEINGTSLPQVRVGSYSEGGSEGSLLREEVGPDRSHLILRTESYGSSNARRTWRVPEGAYFVLGDNRDDSKDSRRWPTTFVPRDHLLGRPMYRHWSSDPETGWPRFDRIGTLAERVDLPAETSPPAGP